jgi:hypothetical protein
MLLGGLRVEHLRIGDVVKRVILVVVGFVAYLTVRALTATAKAPAVDHALQLLRWERHLGIDVEMGLQNAVAGPGIGRRFFNTVYVWAYWPMLIGALAVTSLTAPARYRMLRDSLLISGVCGLALFATFPVAPPRMLDGFVDTVSAASRQHFVAHPSGLVNPYAAFPSFHIGWFALCAIVLCWGRSIVVRLIGALATIAMSLAVVVTANHFVLDVLGGLAICSIALVAARAMEVHRRRNDEATARVRSGCTEPMWRHVGASRRHANATQPATCAPSLWPPPTRDRGEDADAVGDRPGVDRRARRRVRRRPRPPSGSRRPAP